MNSIGPPHPLATSVPPPPPPPPPVGLPPPPSGPPPPPAGVPANRGLKVRSKSNFRRLNWQKIPEVQIHSSSSENIWSHGKNEMSDDDIKLNLATIDELFKLPETSRKKFSRSPSPLSWRGRTDDSTILEEHQVGLVDPKKNLNINIFLRQFKKPTDVIVASIADCNNSILKSEHLRTLLRLLPDDEKESKPFKEFKGDREKLDLAERFLMSVLDIPHYKVRVEAMLLRDEFSHNSKYIEASLSTLHQAMREIRNCRALPKIMHLVLQAGNYLNQGASFGNASGFRLASLKALSDTKANKPGITLMHYVSMTLGSQNKEMIEWPKQLPSLTKACTISYNEIREDIQSFTKRVKSLKKKIKSDLKEKLQTFLDMSDNLLKLLNENVKSVDDDKNNLAEYLCENPKKFQLQECFSIVEDFRKTFVKATKENKEREMRKNKKRGSRISSKSEIIGRSSTAPATSLNKRMADDDSVGRRNTVAITSSNNQQNATSSSASKYNTVNVKKLEHVKLTKLDSVEDMTAKSPTATVNDTPQTTPSVKQAWSENTQVTTPNRLSVEEPTTMDSARRRRRRRSDRSISLIDGLYSEASFRAGTRERLSPGIPTASVDDSILRSKPNEVMIENNLKIEAVEEQNDSAFMQSEKRSAFERTRMRRSYMKINKSETFERKPLESVERRRYRRSQSELPAKTEEEVPTITVNDIPTMEDEPTTKQEEVASTKHTVSRLSTILVENGDSEELKRKNEELRERIRKYKLSKDKEAAAVANVERKRSYSRDSIDSSSEPQRLTENKLDEEKSKSENKDAPVNDRLAARRSRRSARLAQLSAFYRSEDVQDTPTTLLYATTDNSNNTTVHKIETKTDIFSDIASQELEGLENTTEPEEGLKEIADEPKKAAQPKTNLKDESKTKADSVVVDKKTLTATYTKKKTTATTVTRTRKSRDAILNAKSTLKSQSMVNMSSPTRTSKTAKESPKTTRKVTTPQTPKNNSLLRSRKLSSSALNLSTTSNQKTNFVNKNISSIGKKKQTPSKDESKVDDDANRERSASDPIVPNSTDTPQKAKPLSKASSTLHMQKKGTRSATMQKTITVLHHQKTTDKVRRSAPSSYRYQSLPRTPKSVTNTTSSSPSTTVTTRPRSSSKNQLQSPSSKTTNKTATTKSVTPTKKLESKNDGIRSASSVDILKSSTPSRSIASENTRKNLSSRSSADISKVQATGVTLNRAARLRLKMKNATPEKKPMKISNV